MNTSTAANWHKFRDTDEGDDVCTRCRVIVTDDAHMTFTHPCPVPPCQSQNNPNDGCLMAPSKNRPCRCLYCGRTGDRDHETEVVAEIDPEVGEEFLADGTAQLLMSFGAITAGDVFEFALLTGD